MAKVIAWTYARRRHARCAAILARIHDVAVTGLVIP